MKRLAVVLLFPAFIAPFLGRAQEIIKKGETLSLERCIDIALKRHPGLMAAQRTTEANRSRIGQAEANYFPQIDWTSSTGRTAVGPRSSFGFKTRSVTYNSYSTGVSLSQNIYDFGKTAAQVRIQKLDYGASLSDLETTSEQTTFAVKQAYYGVLQAKRNSEVAAEAVKQFELHLEQAKGFYEVGTHPKFDVTKAQVDLSNAKLNLIKAQNALRLALATLNNAMGVIATLDYTLEDSLSSEKYKITFEEALAKAYQTRPDLKSVTAKRQAAESSLSLSRTAYFPILSGTAGYEYGGNSFPLSNGWNIGLSLSFPIFKGFLTTHQVEESLANLSVLRANEELEKQTIFLEVQQAYLSLTEAEELIPTAQLTVEQAQENFEIADGSYREGLGDPIQLTDANVTLSSAKISYIEALYSYKIAQASLEKAMGLR